MRFDLCRYRKPYSTLVKLGKDLTLTKWRSGFRAWPRESLFGANRWVGPNGLLEYIDLVFRHKSARAAAGRLQTLLPCGRDTHSPLLTILGKKVLRKPPFVGPPNRLVVR